MVLSIYEYLGSKGYGIEYFMIFCKVREMVQSIYEYLRREGQGANPI
jgi:hypothetical protein